MTRNTMTTPERIELLREAIEAARQHYYKEHYRANTSVNDISEDLKENRTTSERSYIERELQKENDIRKVSLRHYEHLSHALEHLQEEWSVLLNDERFVEPIITGIGLLQTLIDEERKRWGRTLIDSPEFNIDEAINRYERCGQGKEDYDDAVRFRNLHDLKVWLEGKGALPTVGGISEREVIGSSYQRKQDIIDLINSGKGFFRGWLQKAVGEVEAIQKNKGLDGGCSDTNSGRPTTLSYRKACEVFYDTYSGEFTNYGRSFNHVYQSLKKGHK